MIVVSFLFEYAASQLNTIWAESSIMTLIPSPEIWKQRAILHDIHVGSSNIKISESLGVNQKTVQIIWKELDDFNGDCDGTVARKLQTNHSDKSSRIC